MNKFLFISACIVLCVVFFSVLFFTTSTPDQQEISHGKVTVIEGEVGVNIKGESHSVKRGEEMVINTDDSEGNKTESDWSVLEQTGRSTNVDTGSASSKIIEDATAELDLSQSNVYTIAGYTLDTGGQMLSNVTIAAKSKNSTEEITVSTTSNAGGYYLLSINTPGQYECVSTPAIAFLHSSTLAVLSASSTALRHDFVHEKAELLLRGRVVEENTKTPIANANITLLPKKGETHHEQQTVQVQTSEDGKFTISDISEGIYGLTAEAKGYVPHSLQQKYDNINQFERMIVNAKTTQTEYEIELQKGFMALIRVRDEQGKTIDSANVKIAMKGDYRKVEGQTGEDGEWSVDTLLPSEAAAIVTKEPFGPSVSETFQPTLTGDPPIVDVVMKQPATISGRVTYKKGLLGIFSESRPASDYSLKGYLMSVRNQLDGMSSGGMGGSAKVITDSEGYYTLTGLGEGSNALIVLAKHFHDGPMAEKKINVKAGENRTGVDFQIDEEEEGTETVSGTVVDQYQQPVARADINVNVVMDDRAETLKDLKGGFTDENGRFEYTKVKKGDYFKLFITAEGFKRFHQDYTMPSGPVTVELEPAGSIQGMVVAKDSGLPIPNAKIFLSILDIHPVNQRIFSSDQMGQFLIEGITGKFGLAAEADGYVRTEGGEVRVYSDEAVQNVVLELDPGMSLSGTVIDINQNPIPGAVVGLLSKARNRNPNELYEFSPVSYDNAVVSQPDGSFQFQNISPQGDVLIIHHTQYAPSQYVVTPDSMQDEPVFIWMQPGGRIEGYVYDDNKNPLQNIRLFAFDYPQNLYTFHALTNEEGYYHIDHIPDVEMTIRCQIDPLNKNKPVYKSARIQNQQTIQVDFGSNQGYKIKGVITKNGIPLPDTAVGLFRAEGYPNNPVKVSDTISNPNGEYELSSFPEGQYALVFIDPEVKRTMERFDPSRIPYQGVTITQNQHTHIINQNW